MGAAAQEKFKVLPCREKILSLALIGCAVPGNGLAEGTVVSKDFF
jgi:hypothetical protein